MLCADRGARVEKGSGTRGKYKGLKEQAMLAEDWHGQLAVMCRAYGNTLRMMAVACSSGSHNNWEALQDAMSQVSLEADPLEAHW